MKTWIETGDETKSQLEKKVAESKSETNKELINADELISILKDEAEWAYHCFEEYAYENEIDGDKDWFFFGLERAITIVKSMKERNTNDRRR